VEEHAPDAGRRGCRRTGTAGCCSVAVAGASSEQGRTTSGGPGRSSPLQRPLDELIHLSGPGPRSRAQLGSVGQCRRGRQCDRGRRTSDRIADLPAERRALGYENLRHAHGPVLEALRCPLLVGGRQHLDGEPVCGRGDRRRWRRSRSRCSSRRRRERLSGRCRVPARGDATPSETEPSPVSRRHGAAVPRAWAAPPVGSRRSRSRPTAAGWRVPARIGRFASGRSPTTSTRRTSSRS
jgi:hypothetical protein